MKCSDCVFANKSGNADYVFCMHWQNQANKYPASAEEFVRKVIFQNPHPEQVALGWGYPHKHFKAETHWSVKGTATEGLMYNNQICIEKNDFCLNFKELSEIAN